MSIQANPVNDVILPRTYLMNPAFFNTPVATFTVARPAGQKGLCPPVIP
jgi:hypothetical protein